MASCSAIPKGIIAIIVLMLAVSVSSSSAAKVYNVGDEAGWIVASNYSTWASSKTFRVGDTIVFIYNKSYHNVLEVSKEDYHSCNSSSPIATHATGNDSIHITHYGHRFFICGFPGHCAGGQKLDIRVPNDTSVNPPAGPGAPSASSPAPPDGKTDTAPAPGSQPNGGSAPETAMASGLVIAAVITACAVAFFG